MLKNYRLTRAYNIRLYEVGIGKFASDAEVMETAQMAHLGTVVDTNGDVVKFQRSAEEEPELFDLNWSIDQINGTDRTVVDIAPLRAGYVFTDDVYGLIRDMAELDPDWPGDARAIKELFARAKDVFSRLEKQTDMEAKTWQADSSTSL